MNLQDIITSCYAAAMDISIVLSEANEDKSNTQSITEYLNDAIKQANVLSTCLVMLLDDGLTDNVKYIPDGMDVSECTINF